MCLLFFFFFSSRRRHTRCSRDWSSDVCSSDLARTRGWPNGSSSPPATRCAAIRSSSSKRSAGPTCTSHSRWPSCAPPSSMPRNSRPEGGVRVLHVDSGREFRGGQNQVRLLTRELARDPSVEQRLVTQRGSELARRATAEGGTVREIPWGLGLDPRAWWRLVVESLAWRPDLIHAHNNHPVPLSGWARPLLHFASTAPRVVATRRVVFPVRRRSALRHADAVVAISEAVRATLLAAGFPPGEVKVVPSGVDPDEVRRAAAAPLDLRATLGLPRGARLAPH